MKFFGDNGQEVEFRIEGYEFAEIGNDHYDSNWLKIHANVKLGKASWEITDPCVFTWEMRETVKWFRALAAEGDPEIPGPVFMEPGLSFTMKGKNREGGFVLRIQFRWTMIPCHIDEDKEYYVDCVMNAGQLSAAADALEKELEAYPERGPQYLQ
jgi:hypothetical protein